MGRYLGNNGEFYADISETADGAALTKIPFVKEISPNQNRPRIDVTAMGDAQAAKLADFEDFELTIAAYDDSATNALATIGDGKPRLCMFVYDGTATTKKGGYGTMQGGWNPKIAVRAGVDGTLTLTGDGAITPFFQASLPDPTAP